MLFVIVGALLIGVTLGLMGSGGSILTLPVLTYLLGHDSKVAIAESLAIVGGIAFVAAAPYAYSRQVAWRSVFYFGLPGMAGAYVGAWFAGYVSGAVQLTVFAVVMLAASVLMFRKPQPVSGQQKAEDQHAEEGRPESDGTLGDASQDHSHAIWKVGLEGFSVGVVTGLVGVGGGFLIVPALVVLGRLPMRLAVGTSLAVIALKSASGLYKYLDDVGSSIDWWTVSAFVILGILGSFAGKLLNAQIDQQLLRRGFAVFLLVMGVVVLGKEAPAVFSQQAKSASVPTAETIDMEPSAIIPKGELDP